MEYAIFLAALGITVLELSEAFASALGIYATTRDPMSFASVSLGIVVIFVPTVFLGGAIARLPLVAVRVVAATLLLYFGIRLTKSAKRAFLKIRKGTHTEEKERGLFATGFSIGAIEAFEAAIVLVALLPNGFYSTVSGLLAGVLLVLAGTYILRGQVRRMKGPYVKVFVAALLLAFSTFWYLEALRPLPDLILVPLFALYAVLVTGYAKHLAQKVPEPSST